MKTSIVIPVHKGARTIGALTEALINTIKGCELEIVLVNDGSPDNSHEICLGLHKRYLAIVRYICLSRNFGEHNAVMAGLNYASGDYAVIIDDDFQNPPEEISKLVDEAVTKNYDVVYSYYSRKQHSYFRNLGSSFNNLVASFLLNKPADLYLSSFKCMNRFVIDEVIKYKGPFPYIDGLVWRCTKNIGKVLVRHEMRQEGKSGYTMRKLVRLWLNMFVNFSIYPLRLSIVIGFIFSLLGGVSSIFVVVDRMLHPGIPLGVTSILIATLVFSGVQLIMLGLIGEYLGKLFMTDNQTPQYVVRNAFTADRKG